MWCSKPFIAVVTLLATMSSALPHHDGNGRTIQNLYGRADSLGAALDQPLKHRFDSMGLNGRLRRRSEQNMPDWLNERDATDRDHMSPGILPPLPNLPSIQPLRSDGNEVGADVE